jgi:hypothetical protein
VKLGISSAENPILVLWSAIENSYMVPGSACDRGQRKGRFNVALNYEIKLYIMIAYGGVEA